jgi:hypothetical protein
MRIRELLRPIEGVRRKLRALAAVLADPAATDHERANADALKRRLEARLRRAGVPEGDWTATAFRLGRAVKDMKNATSPASPEGDWTDDAFRLGRALRRGYKKWLST